MKRLVFAMFLATLGTVQAANPRLIAVSQRNGPHISYYGTNKYLFVDQMGFDFPEEIIPSSPPFDLASTMPNTAMQQPFGPNGRRASVFTANIFLNDGLYHDVVVIGEGRYAGNQSRVLVFINQASIDPLGVFGGLVGRANRGNFELAASFDVDGELPGAAADGLNVAAGDFDWDPTTLDIAVSRQAGDVDVQTYSIDLSAYVFGNVPMGGYTVTPVYNFSAYPDVPATYNGGVRLAVSRFVPSALLEGVIIGSVDAEDLLFKERLITAPGKGYKPWVKCWDVDSQDNIGLIAAFGGPWVLNEFLAFSPKFTGGVNLCADEDLLEGILGIITSIFGAPDQIPEGLFPCLIATQASGGGTAHVYFPNYISGEWQRVSKIKPFGASYSGGLSATVSDISLRGVAAKVGFCGQSSNTGFRWFSIDVFTQFLNSADLRVGATELSIYRFKPKFGPGAAGAKTGSPTDVYRSSP